MENYSRVSLVSRLTLHSTPGASRHPRQRGTTRDVSPLNTHSTRGGQHVSLFIYHHLFHPRRFMPPPPAGDNTSDVSPLTLHSTPGASRHPRQRGTTRLTFHPSPLTSHAFCGTTSLNPLPWMFTISMLESSLRYFLSFAIYTSILLPLK
jgi:hypothetical protein